MAEAEPARFMLPSAWVLTKVCGEPVSKWATQPSCTVTGPLWILILVKKESAHRYYTTKTRPLLGEQGKVLAGVGADITAWTSPP